MNGCGGEQSYGFVKKYLSCFFKCHSTSGCRIDNKGKCRTYKLQIYIPQLDGQSHLVW